MFTNNTINTPNLQNVDTQVIVKRTSFTYRGFSSIDQEMEREIAMQRFSKSEEQVFTHRSFLLKK